MSDFSDAILDVVDQRIQDSKEITSAVGTISSLTPLTVIFDGAATATPVIAHGDVALVDGGRVTLTQYGTDWTVVGTFAPGPYTKTFAGLTAASANVSGIATLAGGGTLTGTFAGTKTLSGANTFSGTNNFTNTVTLTGTTLTASGTVNLTGTWAGSHTLSGTSTYSGTLTSSGGSLTGSWAGAPTFSGAPVFSGTTEFSGDITMTGTPIISGSFTVNDTLTGSTATLAGTWAGSPTFSGQPSYGLGTGASVFDHGTAHSSTSTSYVDVAGLSVAYTKLRTNSIILVMASATMFSSVNGDVMTLGVSDGTTDHDVGGIAQAVTTHYTATGTAVISGLATGARTYKVRLKRASGTGTVTRDGNDYGSLSVIEVG